MVISDEVPTMQIGTMHFSKKDIPNIAAIMVSALIYACGFNIFVRSGNLFPGGFAGMSRLLSMVLEDWLALHISFSIIYFALNSLVTMLVIRKTGHKFILYSVLWYSLSSLFTGMIRLPVITQDPLLIAVFGGLVNGFAIGTALRYDASSGGTDFLAIDLSIRLNRPTWNYIFAFNASVLFLAGFLYGWERALYSIIFQYVSKEVVSMMHERYKITRIQVVTDHADEICSEVFRICRHGITKLKCVGAYSNKEHELLMMSVNNNQLKDVEEVILRIDPHAFMSLTHVDRIIGNYYQKPME